MSRGIDLLYRVGDHLKNEFTFGPYECNETLLSRLEGGHAQPTEHGIGHLSVINRGTLHRFDKETSLIFGARTYFIFPRFPPTAFKWEETVSLSIFTEKPIFLPRISEGRRISF